MSGGSYDPSLKYMRDEELVVRLRREATAFFRNQSLLELEEFIRRFERLKRGQ